MTNNIEAQINAQIVLDHIEQHPNLHEQVSWAGKSACGTTGCVAGWTVMLCDGWKYDEMWGLVDAEGNTARNAYVFREATASLGLEEEEARELFSLKNKETAREALRYIAHGKQIDWEKIASEYDTEQINFFPGWFTHYSSPRS